MKVIEMGKYAEGQKLELRYTVWGLMEQPEQETKPVTFIRHDAVTGKAVVRYANKKVRKVEYHKLQTEHEGE